jgi:hypothetical protein
MLPQVDGWCCCVRVQGATSGTQSAEMAGDHSRHHAWRALVQNQLLAPSPVLALAMREGLLLLLDTVSTLPAAHAAGSARMQPPACWHRATATDVVADALPRARGSGGGQQQA